MAKGDKCVISNCKNIISQGRKGLICGTHQYRKRMFGSYDLPGYVGDPSHIIEEVLPPGRVKKCDMHGYLSIDEVYPKYYKQKVTSYNCKKCMLSNNIRKKYEGMSSLDDYDKMLESQGGVCGICKGHNTTTRNGKIKRFSIDHSHRNGKTRELLCQFCNALLGYAKDSISILDSAKMYLIKHGVTE